MVLAASIFHFASVIWIINRSRRWLFWSGTVMEIGLTSISDIASVMTRGVSATHNAIVISVVAATSVLIAQSFVSIYGFTHGPRRAGPEICVITESV